MLKSASYVNSGYLRIGYGKVEGSDTDRDGDVNIVGIDLRQTIALLHIVRCGGAR